MKTILNLIITTFGVLFILSACGGGGADVTIGLENRTCTNNPFSDDCGTSGQATRTDAITDCVEKGECDDNIPDSVQTCLTDLFGDDCDAVAETIASRTSVTVAKLRMTFCEANKADDNCQTTTPDPNPDPNPDPTTEPTLAEVCMGNPFNTRCLTEYNEAREIACRGDTKEDCTATITRYCETEATPANGNTLNPLCADVKYNTPRETACRTGSHDMLCSATITRFCETEATPTNGNTLNSLCADVKYNTPRETACRTGSHDMLCSATITRFCETEATPANGNTLNPLCGAVKYNTPREAACRTGNHANLCGDTIMRFCTTNPTLDTYFDPLCVADMTAIMKRDEHCVIGGAMATGNAFTPRCADNEKGIEVRNNHCGTGTDATSPAFTERCVDDAKGIEVRNAYCVMGGADLATGNAFKPECVHSPAGNAIVLASSECMDVTTTSYGLANLNDPRGCLPALEAICKAGVALFDTRCESARTERCSVAAGWLYEPLCAGDDYQVRRETACLGQRTDNLNKGCRDTVYVPLCGAQAENPFDRTAGATGMINCLALERTARYGNLDYADIRQSVCGNSRPVPVSKFETECNDLITNLCNPNPFNTEAGTPLGSARYNCYTDGAFDMQRDTVRIGCRVGTAAATDPNCFDLATLEPCTRDPLRDECDPEEFKEARIARISYCEGVPSELSTEFAPQALCATYSAPFCLVGPNGETDPRFNPLTPICPQSGLSSLAQLAYCSIGNRWNNLVPGVEETRCRNAGRGCLDNPFGRIRAGVSNLPICGTNPVFFGLAAISNRVKFCSGDVAEADLNLCTFKSDSRDSNTQDMLCMSSGRYANPFVDLCAGVEHDAKRADFLTSCQDNNAFTSACPTVLACMENPYGADCIYHRPYFASRWAIVEACAALPEGEYDATCTEDIRTAIQQACLVDPYEGECKDNRDYASRRTARVNECAGYGSSAEIRTTGGANETRCRVAIDDFCAGDKLFTTDPDGVECFNDDEYGKGSYLADRNMHLAECQKAASARAPRTVCTEVSAHICVSAESEYTNPFLPVCDEDGRSSLVPRQELIKRCQPLDTTTRAEMGNESCVIVKANMILTNCDDNPFHADCTDYSGAGQAYFDKRTQRVMACGVAVSETGARCAGTQARLCVSDTAEAAPLSPACNNVADIATIRNAFLEDCEDGSDVLNCDTTFATTVKTACDADPYVSAIPTADGSTVSCVDFASYDMERGTRLAECEGGRSTGCSETVNIICLGDGEDVNPFNAALCNGVAPDLLAIAQRDFCQIRANVGNDECAGAGKVLTRPTTATALASVDIGSADDVPSIPTAGADNEFLKGTDTGLNTNGFVQADGAAAEVVVINMETAEYDGVPLGFDAADGIAFFAGRPAGGTERIEYYAGILAGADLGAVLAQEADTTVKWYGAVNWAILGGTSKGFNYQTRSGTDTATLDFVLTIDLDAQTFRSFFERGGGTENQAFQLEGGYDATTGVITRGEVYFGANTGDAIARFDGTNGYHFNGPLIGIIGQEGALGVFHAIRHDKEQGESLVGGFVARPPRSDFFSWTRYAVDPAPAPLTIRSTADAGDGEASFIRGGTEALDVGAGGVSYTLTLADDYSLADSQDSQFGGNIVTLGGDESDGISFAVDSDRLYSGLLSGTDVGVPLIGNANYRGLIGILIHKDGETSYEIKHDFYLNVNFGPMTFNDGSATFSNGIFQIMRGKFNKFGLISGMVSLGTSTGTLSGLIGVDGVVGSFISTDHTGGAFAGGFVAHTAFTDLAPRARTTPIWRDNAVTEDGTRFDVLAGGAAVDSGNPATNFIVGGTNALELSSPAVNPEQDTLKADDDYIDSRGDMVRLGGDSRHGVVFAQAIVLSKNKWYAGLLAEVSLGKPVSHTAATADWVGQVGLIKDGINSGNAYTAPLVLTVNFRDREISSPAIAIFADTLTINGRYDGHGLIRGTVSYATPTQTGVGHLTGLIGGGISAGAATAVGAFISGASGDDVGGYSGGFVVREPHGVTITEKVAYGDWVHSFGDTPLLTMPETSALRNQFLQGLANTLPTTGLTITGGAVTTLNLDTATFDGLALGGDSADGVGFLIGTDTGGSISYAGIFNGTDLGAPLVAGSEKAYWNGQFITLGTVGAVNTNFTLEIGFNVVAEVEGSVGSIEAFVRQRGTAHYHLTGTYDGNGVIKGEVDLGTFTAGTRTKANVSRIAGVLTGLIGQEGAVGTFYSDLPQKGNSGYAGGFVATPTAGFDPVVKYSDWVRSFATPPPERLTQTTPRQNQFLGTVTGATKLDEFGNSGGTIQKGRLDLDDSSTDFIFVGDATDGVSFFWDNNNTAGYSGILSSTNLGSPFTQGSGPAKVTWKGHFHALINVVNSDFVLEIDFNNSGKKTIEAFVQQAGNNYYHLKGEFDDNGVIINGTVNYGAFSDTALRTPTGGRAPNGFLTGLIGEQGAVGAFLSGASTSTKDAITSATPVFYTGGFVASPTVQLDPLLVKYNDWVHSFGDTPPPTVPDTTATPRNQFLQGLADTLPTTGLTVDGGAVTTLNLDTATFDGVALGGDSTDGVGFFIGVKSGVDTANYAGIFNGTDLGAPLVAGSEKAYWNGQFQVLGNFGVTSDFTLEVDFNVNDEVADSVGSIEAFVQQDGRAYYHLTGTYDANGVIKGEVDFGNFTVGTRTKADESRTAGVLTGLIGSDGAVGAFISESINTYSGGFVANETAQLDPLLVKYNDWVHSFGDTPPPTVPDTTATPRNQFLQGLADTLPTTGLTVDGGAVTTLNLDTATFDGVPLGGQAADGVGFFVGVKSGVGTANYAGIFNGTDLGAPLVAGSQKAYWNGQFIAVGTFAVNTDFTLEIDFNVNDEVADSVGSIEAFVVQQAGVGYYHLTGTYDDNGVIKGEVDFGNFTAGTRTQDGGSRIAGTLTGLIGSDGAVGAFISERPLTYSGGFVANETVVDRVRFIDWTRSFGDTPPDDAPNTTFTNQFLQGTDTTLTAEVTGLGSANDGTGAITPELLDLATATYGADSDMLMGDAKNGVGFFTGYDSNGVQYYYAGIFNGADLGAPLTADTVTGVWKGQFEVVGSASVDTDFTLEVTFGEVSGVAGSAGSVDAFVFATDTYYYHLTGTYDRNGVITGVVDFGPFTDADKTMPGLVAEERVDGTLNGLIGQAGAIGVFISDKTGSGGYAGGFVACKRNTADTACK